MWACSLSQQIVPTVPLITVLSDIACLKGLCHESKRVKADLLALPDSYLRYGKHILDFWQKFISIKILIIGIENIESVVGEYSQPCCEEVHQIMMIK